MLDFTYINWDRVGCLYARPESKWYHIKDKATNELLKMSDGYTNENIYGKKLKYYVFLDKEEIKVTREVFEQGLLHYCKKWELDFATEIANVNTKLLDIFAENQKELKKIYDLEKYELEESPIDI